MRFRRRDRRGYATDRAISRGWPAPQLDHGPMLSATGAAAG
jgi:hypothetical protein